MYCRSSRMIWIAPAAATPPAYRGHARDHPIAPTELPRTPVRTQVIPAGRPRGRWRAAAYGPRVGGPDRASTLANSGYRTAAPPGNLDGNAGQRPMIHRPHRCRRPEGPRASVALGEASPPRGVDRRPQRAVATAAGVRFQGI
jgi:hypothetical protein